MTHPITKNIHIDSIHTGGNDRTIFKPDKLRELADSISKNGRGEEGRGLIQPITVNLFSPDPGCVFGGDKFGEAAQYTLIAGERRLRACQLLGWNIIPAHIVEISPEESSALMLAENTSREDLDPIDEGKAYRIRVEKFNWTEEQCAAHAGVTVIRIRFRLKLLSLREEFHILIRSNQFPIGYAQILADAKLDTNRQLLAFNLFRDNPRPTPGWFRNVVNQYREQQNQAALFDTSALLVSQRIEDLQQLPDPPHPATTNPPVKGRTPANILRHQIAYWTQAAQAWKEIGKPFKSQECLAAAQALTHLTSRL